MTAYLGPVGSLASFKCPSAVSIDQTRPASYRTTLGGRVKAQRGPLSRRQWSVDISTATPEQVANLHAMVEAGIPPWVWVEPYAQVTNLLSPEQSVLMPGTFSGTGVLEGGAVSVGGVMSPRSVLHATGGTVDFGYRTGVPDRPVVVPGVPVSVSAYVRGAGILGLSWRDWSGAVISEQTAAYSNAALARVSMANLTPPAGAATVRVWATGALQAAMPALSWTPVLAPWSIGRGCNRAVVDGLSEAVQLAVIDEPSLRRSGISFTVREVG